MPWQSDDRPEPYINSFGRLFLPHGLTITPIFSVSRSKINSHPPVQNDNGWFQVQSQPHQLSAPCLLHHDESSANRADDPSALAWGCWDENYPKLIDLQERGKSGSKFASASRFGHRNNQSARSNTSSVEAQVPTSGDRYKGEAGCGAQAAPPDPTHGQASVPAHG